MDEHIRRGEPVPPSTLHRKIKTISVILTKGPARVH